MTTPSLPKFMEGARSGAARYCYDKWPPEACAMVEEVVEYMRSEKVFFSSVVIADRVNQAVKTQGLDCPRISGTQIVSYVRNKLDIPWSELRQ